MEPYHRGVDLNFRSFTSRQIALFWAKVDKSGDCWVWTGGTDRKGYGRLGVYGSKPRAWTGAHRFSYFLEHGSIPTDMVIDHVVCDNPICVRPAHLAPKTQAQNLSRSELTLSGKNLRRTHFNCGCLITEDNTIREGTTRRCRKCRTAYNKMYLADYYQKHRNRA